MTLVCETLGRDALPLGIIYCPGDDHHPRYRPVWVGRDQSAVLGGFVHGDPPVALGITEPQAGSDAAALKATATFEGDEVVLNGQKMYCTLSKITKYILFMTRDSQGANPYASISMWLLPTDTPGLRFNLLNKVGWWTVPTYEVFIENARVPRKNLVGQYNSGWPQLMANFEIERLALCAASVGAAEGALYDYTVVRQPPRPVRQPDRQLPGCPAHHHRHGRQERNHAKLHLQNRLDDG